MAEGTPAPPPDAARTAKEVAVDVVYARCCGLDVHLKTVVACVVVPGPEGLPRRTVRTFGTMTADLLQLGDWLAAEAVTHVAMESTGIYWRPIWNLLESHDGQFTLLFVNAHHVQQVPGRKTDVKDAEWLADLLRHGLVRGSFVPERPQRELRDLVRYRTCLVRERSREVQRLQKTLEGANIKLAAVVSDLQGKSAQAMLAALVAGVADPVVLADLALRRLRAKIPQLEQALAGQFGPHQRFLVAHQLAHLDFLDESLEQVDVEIDARLAPFRAVLARLETIPGVKRRTAQTLVAELGADMTRFPTPGHLASWAGMCPGHHESAGKQTSGRTRKGNAWLRAALVEAAHGSARSRGTYLAAQYRRLASRRGKKPAAVAVGHTILGIAHHLLTHGTTYVDLGANSFDERDRQAIERRLRRRLEALGYTVSLEPTSP